MERRRDPWNTASREAYTYDEFMGFYGPEGHKAWNLARPRSRFWVGQSVVAITSLKGEEGQTVNKGDFGKVTGVPGPNSNIDPGAIAEVLINGVRFDAKPDMVEPAQGGKPQERGPPTDRVRTERRYDPNEPGHKKAYTKEEFLAEYGKKKGETLWATAGEGKVEKRCDPKEPGKKAKYSKKEFFDFYGEKEGLTLWKKAAPAEGRGDRRGERDEKRTDPNETNGKKYTKKEFMEHYGGEKGKKLWNGAAKVDKRADPNENNGKKYAKKDFVKLYGEKKGNALWKKAGETKSVKPDKIIKIEIERGEDGAIGWSREELKIVEVDEEGPAQKAGVKPLFKITSVSGKPATPENVAQLLKDAEPLAVEFVELRIDSTDPRRREFTHSMFLEYYGAEKGAVMWKKAGQRRRRRTKKDKDGEEECEEDEEETATPSKETKGKDEKDDAKGEEKEAEEAK
eukprot:TRINITY_DN27004_c0_g1_i1.p1 TRINITY_DN27004_c0_g1~~TRINITY_DN27004_c0_g1_i1.p1  ORF type:complete len:455 (+),score=179.33 TRINITY_DN27004_c0_g1_i1:33-1397(+)